MTRTRDLLITSEMHYRLCYTSIFSPIIISAIGLKVNTYFRRQILAPISRIFSRMDSRSSKVSGRLLTSRNSAEG